jgi:N-acetylneuraminate synthase
MTLIVAEIGINHNGDLKIAERLIQIAAAAGCDYVKFQKRSPDICVPELMKTKPKETPWGTMSYLDYRKRVEFDREQYGIIDDLCIKYGIDWFASVWDRGSAAMMAELGCHIAKIPSAKITDHTLLTMTRGWFHTMVMSTGMSTQVEIDAAVAVAKPDYLLHTHSAYPAPVHELDLTYIYELKRRYSGCLIGYSGHEYGLVPTFAAVAMGAQMIERHITLDRNMWGSDQQSSVEPGGLFKLVQGIRAIELAIAHKHTPEGVEDGRVVWPSEQPKRDALRG